MNKSKLAISATVFMLLCGVVAASLTTRLEKSLGSINGLLLETQAPIGIFITKTANSNLNEIYDDLENFQKLYRTATLNISKIDYKLRQGSTKKFDFSKLNNHDKQEAIFVFRKYFSGIGVSYEFHKFDIDKNIIAGDSGFKEIEMEIVKSASKKLALSLPTKGFIYHTNDKELKDQAKRDDFLYFGTPDIVAVSEVLLGEAKFHNVAYLYDDWSLHAASKEYKQEELKLYFSNGFIAGDINTVSTEAALTIFSRASAEFFQNYKKFIEVLKKPEDYEKLEYLRADAISSASDVLRIISIIQKSALANDLK